MLARAMFTMLSLQSTDCSSDGNNAPAAALEMLDCCLQRLQRVAAQLRNVDDCHVYDDLLSVFDVAAFNSAVHLCQHGSWMEHSLACAAVAYALAVMRAVFASTGGKGGQSSAQQQSSQARGATPRVQRRELLGKLAARSGKAHLVQRALACACACVSGVAAVACGRVAEVTGAVAGDVVAVLCTAAAAWTSTAATATKGSQPMSTSSPLALEAFVFSRLHGDVDGDMAHLLSALVPVQARALLCACFLACLFVPVYIRVRVSCVNVLYFGR